MSRVGFVGLGRMGGPMATRLVEAGNDVVGFDVATAARAQLEQAGGTAVAGMADIGAVEFVMLMLPSSDVVEAVLVAGGLLSTLRAGTVIVDMSSSEPLKTRELASLAAERSIVLLDAPVSGGVRGAVAGTLSIMVGGRDDDVERIRPLLEVLGRVTHTGAVGSGHALKALNNLLSATHLLVTSEALHAGVRFGLDPKTMLDVINTSSGRSGSTDNKWPNFILPGTYDSGFGAALMLKDMRIATGLIHQLGMPSYLSDQAVGIWADAVGELADGADHTEIARWLELRSATGDAEGKPWATQD